MGPSFRDSLPLPQGLESSYFEVPIHRYNWPANEPISQRIGRTPDLFPSSVSERSNQDTELSKKAWHIPRKDLFLGNGENTCLELETDCWVCERY